MHFLLGQFFSPKYIYFPSLFINIYLLNYYQFNVLDENDIIWFEFSLESFDRMIRDSSSTGFRI